MSGVKTVLDIREHWTLFPFERNLQAKSWLKFLEDHWTMTIYISAFYAISVLLGERIMKNRKPFELRTFLIIWNVLLAVCSTMIFIRLIPDLVDAIFSYGLYESVCKMRHLEDLLYSSWSLVFGLLKIPELFDTAFIILRKKKLIFLHWYHHITVLIYTIHSIQSRTSTGRWFQIVNAFIHSLMYSYYALRAMNVKLPQNVSKTLTVLQISQMAVGCIVNYLAYQYKSAGLFCSVSTENFIASTLMYGSYLALFSKFFYDAYIKKHSSKAEKKTN